MEDIRDEKELRRMNDEERAEWNAASEDEVPFHIPRD
jgi:hypothetical protein